MRKNRPPLLRALWLLALAGIPGTARLSAAETATETGTALFAGGCFWCMQPPFDKLDGVVATTVGFAGGKERDPSYEQVAHARTGHTEAIQIVFDPKKVSYRKLLEVFWRNIDPTDGGGQFADRGRQYRPAIFYLDDTQRREALTSRAALEKSGKFRRRIAVEVVKATPFYPAEAYHQKFYKKNPARYYSYRRGSGREGFLERTWGRRSSPVARTRAKPGSRRALPPVPISASGSK